MTETITMKMRGRPVTLAEAMESARRLVNSHFHNPDSARCSIPVDVRDDDVVLTDYLVERQNEDACVSCGKEADGICENCESPLCCECDSEKYYDVFTCKDEVACEKRCAENEAKA